jgi:hypothetical protein
MASLPTVVSRAFHVPNSTWTLAYWPCSANAGPMHLQCNSFGGLCKRGANRVQPQCKSLNTARAVGAIAAGRPQKCLTKRWSLAVSSLLLCGAGYHCSYVEPKSSK